MFAPPRCFVPLPAEKYEFEHKQVEGAIDLDLAITGHLEGRNAIEEKTGHLNSINFINKELNKVK